jgi:hypothetical protein
MRERAGAIAHGAERIGNAIDQGYGWRSLAPSSGDATN